VVVFAATELRAMTTIYVGKHFEVRDHDAPVKYVFNGNTRVARVTGSLLANERIQRLRLRAGWNLVSLAVTAPDFLDQLREFTSGPAPVIKAIYRWQPVTKDYGTIASGESVAAGAVLWVSAQTDAVVAVRGGYVEPSQWGAPGGETFVAVPALEAQPLTVPPGVTVWRYDARSARWQIGLTGDLASLSDLPPTLAPGEAIYVHSNEPTDLGAPAPDERIRYYHQDHLGSSGVMTDANGALVEETAFYPFGIPRNEHRLRQIEENYKFTQKERDRESGLDYFEARYLTPLAGRFLSPDPLPLADAGGRADPQDWNCYAYALNNPLRYVDPHGLYVWDDSLGGSFKDSELKDEIVAQRQAIRDGLKQALKDANTLPKGADKDLVLRALNAYGVEGKDNKISVGNVVSKGESGHTRLHEGRVTVGLEKGMPGWFLGMTLAHEGTHAADFLAIQAAALKDLKKAKSGPLNLTEYEKEFRGIKADAIMLQAISPKVSASLGKDVLWDPNWKPGDIEKNRTAAVNALVAKKYGFTPDKPGDKIIPP